MRSTLSRAAATLVDSSEDHAEGALARWLDSRHRLKDNSETRILEFMTVAGFVNSRKRERLRVELSSLAIYDFLTTADLVKNRPSIHDEGCRLTVGSDDFHGAKEYVHFTAKRAYRTCGGLAGPMLANFVPTLSTVERFLPGR